MGMEESQVEVPTQPSGITYDAWLNKFSGGKKKVLEILIKYKKLTKSQLVAMSGLKKTNITHNILPALKSVGLIEYDSESMRLIS